METNVNRPGESPMGAGTVISKVGPNPQLIIVPMLTTHQQVGKTTRKGPFVPIVGATVFFLLTTLFSIQSVRLKLIVVLSSLP